MFLVKLPVVPPDKNHTHTNWRECAKKYRSTPSSNKNKNCGGYDGTRSLDPWRSRLLLIVRVVGSRAGGTASDGLGHAGGHARGHRGRDVDGHHLSAVQAASGGTAAMANTTPATPPTAMRATAMVDRPEPDWALTA